MPVLASMGGGGGGGGGSGGAAACFLPGFLSAWLVSGYQMFCHHRARYHFLLARFSIAPKTCGVWGDCRGRGNRHVVEVPSARGRGGCKKKNYAW